MLGQGFAIGNGLTNPEIQYKAYTDYALDMGIIKKSDYDRINKVLPVCETAIKLCGNVHLILFLFSFCIRSFIPFLFPFPNTFPLRAMFLSYFFSFISWLLSLL